MSILPETQPKPDPVKGKRSGGSPAKKPVKGKKVAVTPDAIPDQVGEDRLAA